MYFTRALLVFFIALPTWAAPPVYRCETNGKASYSDAPCVGAKAIDVTPTQGADKMTGKSRKGRDVQTIEMNTAFDKAVQPLTGKSHDEMDVMRRRFKLSAQDQNECMRLDGKLPSLETAAAAAASAAKGRADVELYQARKRFFDLKC